MKSLLEVKSPLRSIARSYILTNPESSNIGILEVHVYTCHYSYLYRYNNVCIIVCTLTGTCTLISVLSALIGCDVSRVTGFG